MSLDAHRKSFEVTLKGAMTSQYPNVPIQFENTTIEQAETGWVASYLIDGKSRQLELGPSTKDRHVGMIQVSVFTPQASGTS